MNGVNDFKRMELNQIILLLTGSFNPPTIQHLRLFDVAKDYFQNQKKRTVVGGIVSPVHDAYGKKGLVPSKHRLKMIRLAITANSDLICSDWELNQSGWTPSRVLLQSTYKNLKNYIYDSYNLITSPPEKRIKESEHIKKTESKKWIQAMNFNEEYDLKLLCGADLLESFSTPGVWDEKDIEIILRDFGIVVVTREDTDVNRFIYENDLVYKYRHNIDIVYNWMGTDISSTKIRRALKRKESVRYLVPDLVINYIKENDLFKT